MSRTSAHTALDWLRAQLNEMGSFRNATTRDTQFKQWRQNTLTVIQRIWPGVTERSLRFKKVPFAPASNLADSRQVRESFERGCAEAAELLNHWIQEIEQHGVIHVASVQTQSSAEVADYAATLTLDHAPSDESGGEPEDEVRTLDLHDAPAPSAQPPAQGTTPGHAPAEGPKGKARKPPAGKPKTRLKDLLGLSHLSAAQGAADHSSTAPGEAPPAPLRSAFSAPPPFLEPAETPAPPEFPTPPPAPEAEAFPAPPPIPLAPPEAAFPSPPPAHEFQAVAPFPTPPPEAYQPAEAPEDVEDLPAPEEHVFAQREIDLDTPEGLDAQAYEAVIAKLESEASLDPAMFEQLEAEARNDLSVLPEGVVSFPPPAPASLPAPPAPASPPAPSAPPLTLAAAGSMVSPEAPPASKPISSAFAAPAPIETEPPRPAPPPTADPASLLQVVSVDTPRTPPADPGIVTDDIGPGRFGARTAPVAALAAEVDHMDIPPIDRVALKRFLIDLALRLESDTCGWVDLRAAIITVMEYPQLARRALPALLPFLDRAA